MPLNALIIFVKDAVPGKVKTRLAAEIGDEQALNIYQRLLLHTLSVTAQLPTEKYVYYSDMIPAEDIWPDEKYTKRVQSGLDLGERMERALTEVCAVHPKAILIGSDIADLDTEILLESLRSLDFVDVVIGPATDGGYYLIGFRKVHPAVFRNIQWSTSSVFHDTCMRILDTGLNFKILGQKSDIDTKSDLIELGWMS